jgi:dimethylargininase
MPAGFPAVKEMLTQHGFKTHEINMSEFSKIDGGLTCLSLRFNA